MASIKRLEAELAAAERGPALQRQMLAKVEAMARRKLAVLQQAVGRPGGHTREVFADVFGRGTFCPRPSSGPTRAGSRDGCGGSRARPGSI